MQTADFPCGSSILDLRLTELGLSLGYQTAWSTPADHLALAQEAERLGFDAVFTAEAWGSDAFTPLAWWGRETSKLRLGTSVIQLSARTPTACAMAALTLDHARKVLRDSASVLDATYEVGLSGPGRLHDLFVTHDAMTPGDYKARGAGIVIRWAIHASPFGHALVMITDRGLAGLAFADAGSETADDTGSQPAASGQSCGGAEKQRHRLVIMKRR